MVLGVSRAVTGGISGFHARSMRLQGAKGHSKRITPVYQSVSVAFHWVTCGFRGSYGNSRVVPESLKGLGVLCGFKGFQE